MNLLKVLQLVFLICGVCGLPTPDEQQKPYAPREELSNQNPSSEKDKPNQIEDQRSLDTNPTSPAKSPELDRSNPIQEPRKLGNDQPNVAQEPKALPPQPNSLPDLKDVPPQDKGINRDTQQPKANQEPGQQPNLPKEQLPTGHQEEPKLKEPTSPSQLKNEGQPSEESKKKDDKLQGKPVKEFTITKVLLGRSPSPGFYTLSSNPEDVRPPVVPFPLLGPQMMSQAQQFPQQPFGSLQSSRNPLQNQPMQQNYQRPMNQPLGSPMIQDRLPVRSNSKRNIIFNTIPYNYGRRYYPRGYYPSYPYGIYGGVVGYDPYIGYDYYFDDFYDDLYYDEGIFDVWNGWNGYY